MNKTAMILLNQSSKILILLYTPPIPEIVKAIIHAKIMTGIPVASAKTKGRYKPEALVTVRGTSIPK